MAHTHYVGFGVDDGLYQAIVNTADQLDMPVAQLLRAAAAHHVGYALDMSPSKPGARAKYATEQDRIEARNARRRSRREQEAKILALYHRLEKQVSHGDN